MELLERVRDQGCLSDICVSTKGGILVKRPGIRESSMTEGK